MSQWIDAARLGLRLGQLGTSRAALLGARALLFLTFGFTLDAGAYGNVAVLLTLGTFGAVLMDGGIGLLMLERAGKDPLRARQALGGLIVLRLGALPVLLGAHFLIARLILGGTVEWRATMSLGLYALLSPLILAGLALLRGMRRTADEAVASLMIHGAEALVIVTWAVSGERQLWWLGVGLASSRTLGVAALLLWLALRHRAPLMPSESITLLRLGRKEAGMLLALTVAQFVYGQADVLMLQLLRNPDETGRYWACYRLVVTMLLPIDLLLQAVMPKLSSAETLADRQALFSGTHAIGLGLLAVVAGSVLVDSRSVASQLLSAQTTDVSGLLSFLVVGVAFSYLPPYGLGLAMIGGLPIMVKASAIAALANIVLCALLIPRWGANGAAAATLLTFVLLKMMLWFAFRAQGLQPMPWPALGRLAALAVGGFVLHAFQLAGLTALAIWLAASGALLMHLIRRHAGVIEGIA